MIRRRLALPALGAALLVAGLLLGLQALAGRGRRGALAEVVEPGARVPTVAELVEPARSAAARVEKEAERREPRDGAVVETPARAAPGAGDGVRLRGRLSFSRDGRAAPDVELVFHSGTGAVSATTDADGAFATDALVAVGLVRASQSSPRLATRHLHAADLWLERSGFVVPESALALGEHAVELVLLEPDAFLAVQVLRDGAPAAAHVHWSSRGAAGYGTRRTDETGRLELAFAQLAEGDRVRLVASDDAARSDELVLAYPWTGTTLVSLELLPAGQVEVRVVDLDGRPLAGRRVHAGEERASTGRDGRVGLEVRAGPALVGLVEEGAPPDQLVTVPHGDSVVVELVSASRLVAAGRVVSEEDAPLSGILVLATAPGLESSARSDDAGRFEIRAAFPPGLAEIFVAAGGFVEAERFDPGEARVAIGATDLAFRRAGAPEELDLSLAILDARTGATLVRPVVFVHRAAAPHLGDSWSSADGLLTCSLRGHDDLVLAACALGYRERVFSWSELEPAARAGRVLEIALEPGFELTLETWSGGTHAPLAGVTFHADGALLATSGPDGRARLSSATWPARVRVEAPGCAPLEIEARELLFERVVRLVGR